MDWAVISFIEIGSFYLSSTGPSTDARPSQVFLPLPEDIFMSHRPAGNIDPEFGGGGIAAKAWLEDAGEYRAKTRKDCSIRTEMTAAYMVKAMWPVHIAT
jgi:hypothetical protein